MKKRWFSLLLCLALLIGFMAGMGVLADTEARAANNTDYIYVSTYEQLKVALMQKTETTIILTESIRETSAMEAHQELDVYGKHTIYMNGYDIYRKDYVSDYRLFEIYPDAELTVINNEDSQSVIWFDNRGSSCELFTVHGSLTVKGNILLTVTNSDGRCVVSLRSSASLTLDGASIGPDPSGNLTYYQGIDAENGATIVMKRGTIYRGGVPVRPGSVIEYNLIQYARFIDGTAVRPNFYMFSVTKANIDSFNYSAYNLITGESIPIFMSFEDGYDALGKGSSFLHFTAEDGGEWYTFDCHNISRDDFMVSIHSKNYFSQVFPDSTFSNYIQTHFDTNHDNYLSDDEISAITTIDVSGLGISSLEGIERFTNLKSLNCSNNNLSELDVSFNCALETLNCSGNNLTQLDVSWNKQLTTLSCSSNQLVSLNVSGCTALTKLNCSSNQLKDLYVGANTALTDLACSGNQLTSLYVSNNPDLKKLDCRSNQLTSLNVKACTALTELRCSFNQVSSLDVSKNTALTTLVCSSNSLTNLDVSKNTALTEFACSSNNLTNLDVSKNTELTILHCNDNRLTSLAVNTTKLFSGNSSYLGNQQEDRTITVIMTGSQQSNYLDAYADDDGNARVDIVLAEFTITGFSTPVAGANPTYGLTSDKGTVKDVTWTVVGSSGQKMPATDTFEAGKMYQLSVTLTADFPLDLNALAKLVDASNSNSKKNTMNMTSATVSADGNALTVTAIFAPKDPAMDEIGLLYVDGYLNVAGRGLVITGHVESGEIHKGDTMYYYDADGTAHTVEVLSIEMFQKEIQTCYAGDDVGILLGDRMTSSQVAMGDALVSVKASEADCLSVVTRAQGTLFVNYSKGSDGIAAVSDGDTLRCYPGGSQTVSTAALSKTVTPGSGLQNAQLVFNRSYLLYNGATTSIINSKGATVGQFTASVKSISYITGDVNKDGKVNLADVSILFRYLSGQVSLSSINRRAGEVNGDNLINLKDVSALFDLCQSSATYRVVLTDKGTSTQKILDAVRSITGSGLMDAKTLLDGLSSGPVVIKDDLTYQEAASAVQKLTNAGGTAYIDPC